MLPNLVSFCQASEKLTQRVIAMSIWNKILKRFIGAQCPKVDSGMQGSHPVSIHLEANLTYIDELFTDAADLVCRRLQVGQRRAALVYFKGITDSKLILQGIVGPLLQCKRSATVLDVGECLSAGNLQCVEDLHQALNDMLDGRVLLLCHGLSTAVTIEAVKFAKRAIVEPKSDAAITGPQEGFIESIEDNFALVRRRLRTTQLKSQVLRLGVLTRTPVLICYLQDRVDKQVLAEVEERLKNLQAEGDLPKIVDSSYVTESISDHPRSPFPQILQTERPDVAVAHLVEGRVCLFVDGSPIVLAMPAGFFDFLQTADDYYLHPIFATVARWIRLLALVTSTSASAIYVAITTFHYEVIPSRLLLSVARTRGMVPLSSFVEALVMEVTIELLREATVRLPATVGQVIGVVGALVVGQAAVQAGIVSPLLVIVVAISTIAAFVIPNNEQASALRLLRFPMLISANFL